MNDWIWGAIVVFVAWASYQLGWFRGFDAGEAPWVWSHRSVMQNPNQKEV